jgi:AraC family transcriptional regulator
VTKPEKKAGLERLSGVVLGSLDGGASIEDLARRSHQSRTQYYRLFRALVEETPAAMRRRLLLERAAFQLSRTRTPVTDIAFDANYGSLEAFTRAFGKAFGISPSHFRRTGSLHTYLPAPNGIHFGAPGSAMKGEGNMDLYDRFAGNDSWHTRKLLEYAAVLSDEQLDKKLSTASEILPWRESTDTLRQVLENIVFTKEVWVAALAGHDLPNINGTPKSERNPRTMMARLEKADAEMNRIFQDVGKRGAWDDTFVDALCEPAETFTFGGVFAHIMTFNAHRRLIALDALRRFGAKIEGFGDPIEYEQEIAPWSERVGG